MTAAAIPLLLAPHLGDTRYPWLSVLPIAALILASAVLSVCSSWRLLRASEPFLPLPILANPVMRMGHRVHVILAGRRDRAHHLPAALYEVVHKFTATRLRPQRRSHRGDVDARIDPGGPRHDGSSLTTSACRSSRLVCSIAALVMVWNPATPPIWSSVILSVVAFGIGTTYPVEHGVDPECRVALSGRGRDGGDELLSRADGGVHRARSWAPSCWRRSALHPNCGGHVTVMSATAANALGVDLAHVFRGVFALGVACLIVSLIALLRMEERRRAAAARISRRWRNASPFVARLCLLLLAVALGCRQGNREQRESRLIGARHLSLGSSRNFKRVRPRANQGMCRSNECGARFNLRRMDRLLSMRMLVCGLGVSRHGEHPELHT